MNIHEHQAKELLKDLGVDVLDGYAAFTPEEAAKAFGKGGVPSLLPRRKARGPTGYRGLVYAPVRGRWRTQNVTFYDSCILAM